MITHSYEYVLPGPH